MSDSFSFPEANALTAKLYTKLKRHPKRIVFADGEDIRVLRVAAKMVEMEIAVPILLGNRDRIYQMAEAEGISMLFVNVIEPSTSSEVSLFCKRLEKVSRYQGKEIANPCEIVSRPHNFAAMMVQYGHADGMVAGNQSMPATVFRAAMTMIKPIKEVPTVFGAMILVAPPHLQHFGKDGILFLADCGVIPTPDVKQLASIAVQTGDLARHFLARTPKVAMLSHSTHGSANTESSQRVVAATELARQKVKKNYLDMQIEGELQADVALDPEAAEQKLEGKPAGNPADVLVFPTLDAGHISLKLLQHVGGAQNYGQIIMGLTRPAAQVPRTVSEETLLGTAAIVGIRAIEFHNLYLEKERG
ncbi:hypothetical protein HW115_13795 [Verrucomicrobiaceae bacterium N1E253]|uniref:Phosphate acetyl/butaryl transferase domain-containing protein n=1 Tax=Oceaniferula marina TaxID=2748318 RepID=A0A851GLI4_9BACT|nr:phosphate acyltransferase [Oceaniferula marina]NWK56691.1 hypothetical protein [Oceaniferula marina]